MLNKELRPSEVFVPSQHAFEEILGQEITRVSLEPWSVRLLFETAELHIERNWRLIAPDGTVVDQWRDHDVRDRFELWRVAGKSVESIEFHEDPLPRFVLTATGGWGLEVPADESRYEDWSLIASSALIVCNGKTISVFPPAPGGRASTPLPLRPSEG